MAELTGTTRLAAVIGSPIRHSRSPRIANAAFHEGDIDWAMTAFDVPEGQGAAAVESVRVLGLGGLMVTMPHKAAVIPALDRITPAAEVLGAVNSIAWEGSELVGDNTDGAGLMSALRAEGTVVAGRSCLVLGAGGAARAVVRALADEGAAEVVVINRSADRAESAISLAGAVGRVGSAADVATADLIINATSVGMGASPGDQGPVPVETGSIHSGQVVVDLVYQPLETPFLAAARVQGASTRDGLGMLVHQAALTITRWTGLLPDLSAMRSAARR